MGTFSRVASLSLPCDGEVTCVLKATPRPQTGGHPETGPPRARGQELTCGHPGLTVAFLCGGVKAIRVLIHHASYPALHQGAGFAGQCSEQGWAGLGRRQAGLGRGGRGLRRRWAGLSQEGGSGRSQPDGGRG